MWQQTNILHNGDCLIEMGKIADGSVDLILTDPPYGTVKGMKNLKGWNDNPWDIVIDIPQMFQQCDRILRQNGRCVLFGQEPYTSKIITEAVSNLPFCYRMLWLKNTFANNLLCKTAPVNYFEDIIVFKKTCDSELLHPLREYFRMVLDYIGLSGKQINKRLGHRKAEHVFYVTSRRGSGVGTSQFKLCTEATYNELIQVFGIDRVDGFKSFAELAQINVAFKPTFNLPVGKKIKPNVFRYDRPTKTAHPTQKPVPLLIDLIETYTNAGDTVVDFAFGSGSTGVACARTNRNFIGVEIDKEYFDLASKRIDKARRAGVSLWGVEREE